MKILKIPGDLNAMVDELRELRVTLKTAKEREEVITGKLKDFADRAPATLGFNGKIVAMIAEVNAKKVNLEKLRANYADVAEACTEPNPYLTVKPC